MRLFQNRAIIFAAPPFAMHAAAVPTHRRERVIALHATTVLFSWRSLIYAGALRYGVPPHIVEAVRQFLLRQSRWPVQVQNVPKNTKFPRTRCVSEAEMHQHSFLVEDPPRTSPWEVFYDAPPRLHSRHSPPRRLPATSEP